MPQPPTDASRSIDTISKVIAVLLLFIGLPSYLGLLADRALETEFIMPVAVVLGTCVALASLLILTKRMELEEPKGKSPHYRSPEEMDREEAEWKRSSKADLSSDSSEEKAD